MTDWLMVIITAVYVVATIFIWRANNISAKATKDQLEESKRQFEESQKQAKAELEESKRQFKESQEQAKAELEESKRQFDITKQQAEDQLKEQKIQYEETKRLSMMPVFEMYKSDNTLGDYYWDVYDSNYKHIRSVITLKNIGLGNAKNITYDCRCQEAKNNEYKKQFEPSAMSASDSINIGIEHMLTCTLFITFYFQDLLENDYSQSITIEFGKDKLKISNAPIEKRSI